VGALASVGSLVPVHSRENILLFDLQGNLLSIWTLFIFDVLPTYRGVLRAKLTLDIDVAIYTGLNGRTRLLNFLLVLLVFCCRCGSCCCYIYAIAEVLPLHVVAARRRSRR